MCMEIYLCTIKHGGEVCLGMCTDMSIDMGMGMRITMRGVETKPCGKYMQTCVDMSV